MFFEMGLFNKVRIECIGYEIKTWINDIPAAYLVDTVHKRKNFVEEYSYSNFWHYSLAIPERDIYS